jgi:hypothetical protein
MAWSALIPLGMGLLSAAQANRGQRRSDDLNRRGLELADEQYRSGAPLRRMGMVGLGRNERPMDLGTIGFDAGNPFAAARGPVASTGSLGGYGDAVGFDENTVDTAMSGTTPEDVAWAQRAVSERRPDGSFAFKSSERNHAQRQILDPFQRQRRAGGFGGMTPLGGR